MTATAPTSRLRLGGVPEHFNLPWHQAMADPDLADLDLSWEDQPGGTGQMLTALEEGELDLVSILTEGTVSAIAGGSEITIIQVYVSSPLQWGIFVPGDSPATAVGELGRPRVAISRFRSGSHLVAYVLAEQSAMELQDDQFQIVGGLDGAVEAFKNDGADLFLWEQHMTRPFVEQGVFRQIGTIDSPWPSFVIAARSSVLTGQTTQVGRVVDAVVAHAQALHGLPNRLELLAERYGLTAETAESWLASTEYAKRGPMESAIAGQVLATLRSAGLALPRS